MHAYMKGLFIPSALDAVMQTLTTKSRSFAFPREKSGLVFSTKASSQHRTFNISSPSQSLTILKNTTAD
jgi:hypothetical protein